MQNKLNRPHCLGTPLLPTCDILIEFRVCCSAVHCFIKAYPKLVPSGPLGTYELHDLQPPAPPPPPPAQPNSEYPHPEPNVGPQRRCCVSMGSTAPTVLAIKLKRLLQTAVRTKGTTHVTPKRTARTKTNVKLLSKDTTCRKGVTGATFDPCRSAAAADTTATTATTTATASTVGAAVEPAVLLQVQLQPLLLQ